MSTRHRLVAFRGCAQAGKTSAAVHLARAHGYAHEAFGDALRRVAARLGCFVVLTHAETGARMTYSDALSAYGYERVKTLFPEARPFQNARAGRSRLH